jgi:hypothetical protein
MIPNGQLLGGDARKRAMIMNALKRRGFKNGVADYLLAIPCFRLGWAGLFIEMKRTKGAVTSEAQTEFAQRMERQRYRCIVVQGWMMAADQIFRYLDACDHDGSLTQPAFLKSVSG